MTGRPAWIPTDSICEQAREMALLSASPTT